MVDYAVVIVNGRQYKVSEGEEFLVDKIEGDKADAQVLLLKKGEKMEIGTPVVEKAKVVLKVLGQEKGEKIHIRKYKSKSRYKKHVGFRPQYTRLMVEKITL